VRAVELARQLTAARTKKAASDLLVAAYEAGHRDLFLILQVGLDPRVRPSASVPRIEEDGDEAATFAVQDFIRLFLSDRSGDEMRQAAMACDAATWNDLYRPLLLGESLGKHVTAALLNETVAQQEYGIHIPGCQEAIKLRNLPKAGMWLVDHFLHGRRLLAVTGEQPLVFLDAKGNRVDYTNAALERTARSLTGRLVFDGVLVETDGEACFWLIDVLTHAAYPGKPCNVPQSIRHDALCALAKVGAFSKNKDGVDVLPKVEVDLGDLDATQRIGDLLEYAQLMGRNGLVLKDPDAPYQAGRAKHWKVWR